ncbi:MAG TPA: putative glycoside hydrolase [bacterium]|nr:putative glycoside hydrolase [bacterium]
MADRRILLPLLFLLAFPLTGKDAAPDASSDGSVPDALSYTPAGEDPVRTDVAREAEKAFYVKGTMIALRETASASGRKLLILQNGDIVNFTGVRLSDQGREWMKVTRFTPKGGTVEGWVDSRYLSETKIEGKFSFLKTVDLTPFPKTKGYKENPPVKTRGVYITVYSATPKNIRRYFNMAENGQINTFVVDVKNVEGEILFKSAAAEKHFPAANKRVVYKTTPPFIAEARQKGIYLIARMTAFKDNYYALAYPDRGIMVPGTDELLRDRDKLVWVTPHDRHYWEYLIDLSLEAAAMGFHEIQFDYIRFPDLNKEMDTRNALGESRPQAIQNFLKYAYERLSKAKVYVSADIFGLVPSVADDMAIGQHWETISNVVDYICPMMYPSHYATGFAGLKVPDSDPYKTIRQSALDSVRRNKKLSTPAIIRPWIQDFTAFWVKEHIPYGAKEVEDQIRALRELGIDEYLIWNPRNRYTPITVPKPVKAPETPSPSPSPAGP